MKGSSSVVFVSVLMLRARHVVSCGDDSECLQSREGWGATETCQSSISEYGNAICDNARWGQDMRDCCKHSCDQCPTSAPTTPPPTTPAPSTAPTVCVSCQVAGTTVLAGITEAQFSLPGTSRNYSTVIAHAATGACGSQRGCTSTDVSLESRRRELLHLGTNQRARREGGQVTVVFVLRTASPQLASTATLGLNDWMSSEEFLLAVQGAGGVLAGASGASGTATQESAAPTAAPTAEPEPEGPSKQVIMVGLILVGAVLAIGGVLAAGAFCACGGGTEDAAKEESVILKEVSPVRVDNMLLVHGDADAALASLCSQRSAGMLTTSEFSSMCDQVRLQQAALEIQNQLAESDRKHEGEVLAESEHANLEAESAHYEEADAQHVEAPEDVFKRCIAREITLQKATK